MCSVWLVQITSGVNLIVFNPFVLYTQVSCIHWGFNSSAKVTLLLCPRCFLSCVWAGREALYLSALTLFFFACPISCLLGSPGRAACSERWQCLQCTLWGKYGLSRRYWRWWILRLAYFHSPMFLAKSVGIFILLYGLYHQIVFQIRGGRKHYHCNPHWKFFQIDGLIHHSITPLEMITA